MTEELLVYYVNDRISIKKPVMVVVGNDWEQIDKSPLCPRIFPNNYGIISTFINHEDRQEMADTAEVKHSDDLLIIKPEGDSKIYVYGERGDGLRVGSKSLIQITGILDTNRGDNIDMLDGGRYIIKVTAAEINFFICDENKVLMICKDNNGFVIDDESYLDEDPKNGTAEGGGPQSTSTTTESSPLTQSTQQPTLSPTQENRNEDAKEDN